MKNALVAAILVIATASTGAPAFAQNYGGGTGAPQGGGRAAMGAQGRIPDPATLPAMKKRLDIRTEQETVWKQYVAAVNDAWRAQQQGRPVPHSYPVARQNLLSVLMPDQRRGYEQEMAALPPAGSTVP